MNGNEKCLNLAAALFIKSPIADYVDVFGAEGKGSAQFVCDI